MHQRLYIGNLPYDTSRRELEALFAAFNPSAPVIPTNGKGHPKGFGFIEVDARRVADAVRALNGKELRGRALVVEQARTPSEPARSRSEQRFTTVRRGYTGWGALTGQ